MKDLNREPAGETGLGGVLMVLPEWNMGYVTPEMQQESRRRWIERWQALSEDDMDWNLRYSGLVNERPIEERLALMGFSSNMGTRDSDEPAVLEAPDGELERSVDYTILTTDGHKIRPDNIGEYMDYFATK